jgi:hypothetical protein
MVASLTTMMQNNQELVAPILDALSNFTLLTDDLVRVISHKSTFQVKKTSLTKY